MITSIVRFRFAGEDERIRYVKAEVGDRVLNVGMVEQELHRAKIAGSTVNHRGLVAPHRVLAIVFASQSDRGKVGG